MSIKIQKFCYDLGAQRAAPSIGNVKPVSRYFGVKIETNPA